MRVAFLWVVALSVAGVAIGAEAVPGAGEEAMLGLFPELRTAAAPGWLRPGVRLTFETSSATVPAPKQGGSSAAYAQVSVVAVEPKAVVAELRSYLFAGGKENPVLLHATGQMALPGWGVWWVSPEVLKAAVGRKVENLAILRVQHEVGGKSVPAVRFQLEKPQVRMGQVYEEATGLLLSSSGEVQSDDGSRLLMQCAFVSQRAVVVPWAAAALPPWLAKASLIEYSGSRTLTVPGGPPFGTPCTAKLEIAARGANWVRYTQTSTLAGAYTVPPAVAQSDLVSGAAQFGGLWIGPEAAKALHAGQELDRDPQTGVVTSVSLVGPSALGGDVVVIQEANAAQRIERTYDRASGGLLGITETFFAIHTQNQLRLTKLQ